MKRLQNIHVYHSLYLSFCFIERNRMYQYGNDGFKISSSKDISSKSKRIFEFIIDETLFKVGSEYVWLWLQ